MREREHDEDFGYRDALPNGPAHRRGAGLNPGNRFESVRLHVLGDAMDLQRQEKIAEGKDPDRATEVPVQVFADKTKKLINRVAPTSDVPFNWTINPFRGCSHGWLYSCKRRIEIAGSFLVAALNLCDGEKAVVRLRKAVQGWLALERHTWL